jgi:hypothetical protein
VCESVEFGRKLPCFLESRMAEAVVTGDLPRNRLVLPRTCMGTAVVTVYW